MPKICCCLAGWGLLVALMTSLASAQVLYVATDGDDTWSGSLAQPNAGGDDGPLASIAGARDKLRAMRTLGQITGPVHVQIRGGRYTLSAPIELEAEDSGTPTAPVYFEAYAGEKPELVGGLMVGGWVQEGNHWTAQAPASAEGWDFSSLWVNGERRTPARTPNATNPFGDYPTDNDFFFAAGQVTEPDGGGGEAPSFTRFQYRLGDLAPWPSLQDAHLVVFHAWATSLLRVQSLDTANQVVTFTGPSRWAFGQWRSDQWYYVEHLLEGLDQPGEWYVNRSTGKLYYIPHPTEDLATAEVLVPAGRHLLLLKGIPNQSKFVQYVHFSGLHFRGANFAIPPEGFSGAQAATDAGGAIEATGARFCSFDRCTFSNLGSAGIWWRRGSQDNVLSHSEIRDLGAGAVKIGETTSPSLPADAVLRNTVENNFIRDGGKVLREAAAIWIGRSSNNIISHNDISDFRFTGISIGWQWGYGASSAHHNLVEKNHIYEIGKGQLNDLGAVYTLGESPGTIVRQNLIHDVWSNPKLYGGWGLYTDEGSKGIVFDKNIVYNTENGGFHQHFGQENMVTNNVLAYANVYQIMRTLEEPGSSFTFLRNIVYFNNGQLLGGRWSDDQFSFDYNCYWDLSLHPLDFAGRSFGAWQAAGMDIHSVFADPRFADPASADFTLLPASPALALGFENIDTGEIGLYGEPEWVQKPKGITRPPFEPPDLSKIDEDFETTALGAVALEAATRGEEAGATVRVTNVRSRSGSRSLKFVDQAGLSQHFYPYLAYAPLLQSGLAEGSISVNFEPGALFYYEWRDGNEPYGSGPSLWIDSNGNLKARNQTLMAVPANTWVTLKIRCALGVAADGTYDLEVTIGADPPIAFDDLPCPSPEFERVEWLGIVSDADASQTFYVDDIHFGPVEDDEEVPVGRGAFWACLVLIGVAVRIYGRRRKQDIGGPSRT